MKIENVLTNNILSSQNTQKVESGGFDNLLKKLVAQTNSDLIKAHQAQDLLVSGKTDNMIELMTTIEKADISLRLATEVRNKILEAYQEIMRMQV